MENEKVVEKDVIETPQQYFDAIKGRKHNITDDELNRIYENGLELANKYKVTGQIRGLRKILFCLQTIEKEQELVRHGINTFVYRDDIDFYIDKVTSGQKYKERPVKIIELSRYEREVPDEIVDVVASVGYLFDELYVVYTDYTGKTERQIEAERKQKDPILFGVFLDKKEKVCIDRFYYLGDWVDEYCDLTLDKLVRETSKMGRNIVRTINTPQDVAELKDYIAAHYELEENSVTAFKKVADGDKKQEGLFSKIKTFLSGK